MASAASLAGIELHGLAWRAKLQIKAFIPVVPEIEDVSTIPSIAKAIDDRIQRKLPSLSLTLNDPSLELDFDFDVCETKDDLISALTNLYDWADFERVLIC